MAGARAFIRDLKGKPAILVSTTGLESGYVNVIVEGETIVLMAREWDGLLVWGGVLPEGYSSRYP